MGRRPYTPDDGDCTDCMVALVPDVDDAGTNVDRCKKCGRLYTPRGVQQVQSPTAAVSETAVPAKGAKKKAAPRKPTKVRITKARPRSEHRSNGNGSVKSILASLRKELAQLQDRQANLEDAIAAMERLEA
jgi:DNA-directed RNA polymerase subunit M/transcription elongation factor TFIIS